MEPYELLVDIDKVELDDRRRGLCLVCLDVFVKVVPSVPSFGVDELSRRRRDAQLDSIRCGFDDDGVDDC